MRGKKIGNQWVPFFTAHLFAGQLVRRSEDRRGLISDAFLCGLLISAVIHQCFPKMRLPLGGGFDEMTP